LPERRPPDLPPPAPSPKDTPKEKPPRPGTNREEADSLGEALVKAASEQQDGLLEKLRKGKGPEYTLALAAAIGQLSAEVKEKARQTLVDRLMRFTSATLLAYLGSENPELRRAAALALGLKDNKDHVSELIDLLEDPEPSVVDAAQAALKRLTGREMASKERAEDRPDQTPESRGKTSPAPPPAATRSATEGSRASKGKQPKEKDDLPDPSLVPPQETPRGVKTILQANEIALRSKRASERIQAAQVLGGLGEEGKPARRLLCAAMLDPVVEVRVAAADALKNIDPKIHYQAVLLATEKVTTADEVVRLVRLLEKIQKQEEDGEPLAPLVIFVIKIASSNGADALRNTSLTTLTHIGRKDLASYLVIAKALTDRDPAIRSIALRGLPRMKHGKLAVPKLLALLRVDLPALRIATIETLTDLADESTEEIIYEAIRAQRYHNDESVRTAVDTALNKLENKHDP
jgi:HEAT repeat protein